MLAEVWIATLDFSLKRILWGSWRRRGERRRIAVWNQVVVHWRERREGEEAGERMGERRRSHG